MKPYGMTD